MSSQTPTAVTYSLEEFARNGATLRHNRDGWGIAFARDREALLVKEAQPAGDSAWVKFVADQAIKTTAVIAHVRYATRGRHTMENTHPFRRVLGHRLHLFAHNGTLPDIEKLADETELSFLPIGETDSELAFCMLLSKLKLHYGRDEALSLATRIDVFVDFCAELKKLGPCNFLFYDGEVLFAHADRRIHEVDGELVGPRSPGLHMRRFETCATCNKISCPGLKINLADQTSVLLASVPLEKRGWIELPEGTVLALKEGEILAQV